MCTNHHEGMTCSDDGANCFPTYYILMELFEMYVNLEHKINTLGTVLHTWSRKNINDFTFLNTLKNDIIMDKISVSKINKIGHLVV